MRAKAISGSISMAGANGRKARPSARERKKRRIGNFKPTREPGNKHAPLGTVRYNESWTLRLRL
jgi:hypothetical protein